MTHADGRGYLRADLDAWALAGRRRSTSDGGGVEGGRERVCSPKEAEMQAPEDATRPSVATETGSGHLSVRELATLLQVSRRTLDRYRARGIGPAFEKVDVRVLYARADVEAWLASSRRSLNSAAGEEGPDEGDDTPEGA